MKEEGDGERNAGARREEDRVEVRWGRKRGSQFGILNLANVVLGDVPPHLRICK